MPDDRVVMEVLGAEQELYRAMIAPDFSALERILSPEVVYVHSTSVAETRAEYLAGVAKGLYDYESIASREVRVRIHGAVAIEDGICAMRVGAAGKARDLINLLFVLVWVRERDAWRLVHRHATRMPDQRA
jgi:hypothetical protein